MQDNETYNGLWIPKTIMSQKDLTKCDRDLYANIFGFKSKCCYESNERLAEKLGYGVRTIARSINHLKEKGLIVRILENNNTRKRRLYIAGYEPKEKVFHRQQTKNNRGREQSFPHLCQNGTTNNHLNGQNGTGPVPKRHNNNRGDLCQNGTQRIKEEKIKKKEPSGSAAMEEPQKPSDLTRIATMHSAPKRSDFASDSEFEAAYYAWRSTRSMPQIIHKIKSGILATT